MQNLLQPRVIRTYACATSSPGETLRDRSSSSRWSSAAASVPERRTFAPISATCRVGDLTASRLPPLVTTAL